MLFSSDFSLLLEKLFILPRVVGGEMSNLNAGTTALAATAVRPHMFV